MKSSKVIIILIAILVLHGLVLALVLSNGCSGKDKTKTKKDYAFPAVTLPHSNVQRNIFKQKKTTYSQE